MLISTHRCRKFNHPEFVLELGSGEISIHAEQFLHTVEAMVANGETFQPFDSFQIGWMEGEVRAYDEMRLTLFEPDMQSYPMQFSSGATNSILQMMQQWFTMESFGIPREKMLFPSIKQQVIVCDRFKEARSLYLSRDQGSQEKDSGWFFGCGDADHDHHIIENLRRMTLYEAFLRRREIQNWMTFPYGTMVLIAFNKAPRVWLNDQKLAITPGSFVDKLR